MTKTCTKCEKDKDVKQFSWRNKKKGTRHSWCKSCKQAYESDYYRNSDKRKAQIAAQRKRDVERVHTFIRETKSVPCCDCGKRYPYYVMDFDHLSNKEANVSRLYGCSLERVKKEVDKCEIVCSNCHRERTHSRR